MSAGANTTVESGAKDLQVDVYVPFCDNSKCTYCTRLVCITKRGLVTNYLEALTREIEGAAGDLADRTIRTIHITGGCPTTLLGSGLKTLFVALKRSLPQFESAEITFDLVPGHVSLAIMTQLRNYRVKHIDIGLQTVDQDEFDLLGRPFYLADVMAGLNLGILDAYENAELTGLDFDLLYGIPGQTEKTLGYSLEQALKYDPDGVSLYPLDIREETPLFERCEDGSVKRPTPEEVADLYRFANDLLVEKGYHPYTMNRYAKEGCENQNDLLRCKGTDHIGFGVGANTLIDGVSYSNTADIDTYIAHSAEPALIAEGLCRLDEKSRMLARATQDLTLTEGISIEAFDAAFEHSYDEVFGALTEALVGEGLLAEREGHVVLTVPGIVAAQDVFRRFSEAAGIS
jgi:oxygen-independent coproporphyrinogen-3 oxidase